MFLRRSTLLVLLLHCIGISMAEARPAFADAAALRYADEQLLFLQQLVGTKPSVKESPAKSLIATMRAAQANDARPPMSNLALSKDSTLSGALLVEYAEALYLAEQYESADQVLAMLSPAARQAEEKRVGKLKLRLSLRGVGPLTMPVKSPLDDPSQVLNQALLAVRLDDQAGAIKQLKALHGDAKASLVARHRAALWLAMVYGQQSAQADVLSVLEGLDTHSELLAEASLTILRLYNDVHPIAAGAIEQRLIQRIPESSARWEARDYLIRTLLDKGATAQASELAMGAVSILSASVEKIDAQLLDIRRAPVTELLPMLETLSDGSQARAKELVRREAALRKAATLLRDWRPHLEMYLTRLENNPGQFAAEVSEELSALKKDMRGNSKDSGRLSELFRWELSSLIGSPANRDMAYRLFFGFAQWELGYEYPEDWRPAFERPTEDLSGKRRRVRDAAQRLDQQDLEQLPVALDHLAKFLVNVDARVSKHGSKVYAGMLKRGRSLSQRSEEKIKEIGQILPSLDDGIRAELSQGLAERRKLTQKWRVRFAGQAVAAYERHRSTGTQAYFDLSKTLTIMAGESLVRNIQSLNGGAQSRPSGELNMLPVSGVLKALADSAEDRQVRADAHRLRGQLTVALYEAQAISSTAEAVAHYLTLQRDYADLIDQAETAYQLARAQDLGQLVGDSLATLSAFAQQFPADGRSIEALFRIGEIHFTRGDYFGAKAAFESVIQRGETRYRDQAEYKLAWSLFKMGEYRDALPSFVAVLDRAEDQGRENDGRQSERLKDTFRAVALTFAFMNGATDVEQYFSRVGNRPYVADIYFNLARYYLDHDRINDAASAYEFLVRQAPADARAPTLLAEVIAGARTEQLGKLALEYQERFIDVYAVGATYWKQASAVVQEQINQRMKPYLAEIGQMYHADAQQNKNSASYARAIKYYGQYIATFPTDLQTPRFHFLMAEARFETGDFPAALADFELAGYQYGAHPDAAAAAYAALVSNQKIAEQAAGLDDQKRELRALVTRGERFAGAFPKDSRVDAVLVKSAEDLLLLAEPLEAARLAERLIARQPKDALRRRAWVVVAHGRFENRQFAEAELAYQQALKEKDGADQQDLRERLALAVYRQAEASRTAGDVTAAIAGFLRVGKTAPGTTPVPIAEVDAAALLLQTKQWKVAIEVLEAFQKRYPSHPLAVDIPTRLAYAYESDGRFLVAADMLEAMSLQSRAPTDEALSRQMALRAGELREKGDRVDLAVGSYQRYLLRFPAPLEKATEVRQLLADLAGKANDSVTRDRWLSEVIAYARGVEDASPRVRYLAGQAASSLGDVQAATFNDIALKLPLDKALAAKRKAMEGALNWYETAGQFGVLEVTTAATYKIAELYRQLAGDILTSERPASLSPLELGQYNILLEEESFPFEEKSAEFHVLNHQRVRGGSYDEWIKRSLISLQKLVPARYDKVESTAGYFDYVPPKPVKKDDGKPKGAGAGGPEPVPAPKGDSLAAPRS